MLAGVLGHLTTRARGVANAPLIVAVGYVVLLLCVPSQLVLGPLGAAGSPASLWGMAALVWWCASTLGGQNATRGLTAVRVAVLALVCCVLAAYANGNARGWYAPLTVRQETDELWTLAPQTLSHVAGMMISAGDRGVLAFAAWIGIVLVVADGIRSWCDLERLVTWLTWVGAVIAAVGLLQFITGHNLAGSISVPGLVANSEIGGTQTRSIFNRVSATAVHPIEFGVVLACIFPLALHRTIHQWGRRGAALPGVLILVGACVSISRSAVLALLVAMLVLFLGWPARWRVRALLLAPVAVVALRVAIPGLVGTIVSMFRNLFDDPSVTGRTTDYDVVLDLYADHWLIGRGLFTFIPRYYRILDNQYLMLLVEIGILGLLAVLVFLAVAFLNGIGARRARDPRARHLGLALAASVAGGAVGMFTFDAWGFPMAAGIGFLVAGMAGAARRLARADGVPPVGRTPVPAPYRASDEPSDQTPHVVQTGGPADVRG
ncbi:O-antigen ligase [Nocardioides sp. zg-DK7169]|uniref:O-antigen ligase family protein n=1 Tax=Nocardioides sp. zg-DK7169 TaxID=2736600 RepID=UPI001552EAC0|nr:O-antigen ligase family protein [Nocardioides sp. zg-DK7169]NPC97940.1 O-antigen ligase family protein [Nocardioides sp. zg-DK7169]